MKLIFLLRTLVITVALAAVSASAQQSLVMSQLSLQFRVLSRAAKPDAATSEALRKLEQAAQEARAQGRTGEVMRHLRHGIALLEGKPWNAQAEFGASLLLDTDMMVCDPARPLFARVRQVYPAKADGKMSAQVTLHERGPAGQPKPGGQKLVSVEQFPTDMVYEPLKLALDLSGVKSGSYQLVVEVRAGDQTVQRLNTPVYLVAGLDSKRVDLENRLKKIEGHEGEKATVRYPFDVARVLNLGQTSLAPGYSFDKGIADSENLVAQLEAGKNPFANATGVLERHYLLKNAEEIMPYRVYVPKAFDPAKTYPLIIALHGLGGTEVTMLPSANAPLAKLAEEHGYIVASPMGYRRNGGYGRTPPTVNDTASSRMAKLSEEDVMNVLGLMRTQYKIDPKRTYLTGHSMGGNGTWTLGARYAETWAAIAPIAAGSATPDSVPLKNLKANNVPVMVVHGDADRTTQVEGSRAMVAEMKKLGITHEYIEVKGGTHGDVVAPNFPRIVEYFNRHPKGAAMAQ